MPLTSNWNIWTPDDADNYDFIVDSAATAQTVDDALTAVASAFRGTVAERTAFTSTAVDGMLWQDTDGIKMIWRKNGVAWVPAVWRWSGTTAQMNAFTQAPIGFEWFNSSDSFSYIRESGSWKKGFGSTPFSSLPVSGGSGMCQWRNVAGWIFFQFDITYSGGNMAGDFQWNNITTLPVEARPASIAALAAWGGSVRLASAAVRPDGTVLWSQQSSTPTNRAVGAGSWPAPVA